MHHVFIARAGVGGDEVGDEVLLFTRFRAVLFKQGFELVVAADAGLHHLGERALLGVLGRDFEVAADMVGHQFFDVLGALHGQVVAQAGADQNLFHAFERPGAAVHVDQRGVAGVQVRANAGVDAARLAAGGFNLGGFAADAVHIGGRAAQV